MKIMAMMVMMIILGLSKSLLTKKLNFLKGFFLHLMRLSFDFWLWVFNVMCNIYYVCWFFPSSPEWSQYCHDQWSFQCMNVWRLQTFLLRIFESQYQTTLSSGILDYSLFSLCLYLILILKQYWLCKKNLDLFLFIFLNSLRIVYRSSLKVW